MSATAADLIAAIEAHHLLPARPMQELRDVLIAKFPDPADLAAELRRRGWLTAYQLERLARGEGQELVLGPYRLLEPIGRGGMGQVFKARHALMGRVVAIKLIRPELLDRPDAVRRFRREIRAAARLNHPNVVTTHDAQQVDGRVFLVMELCDGTDLARLVEENGPLPVGLACEYARQTALGLAHIHKHGLVHRDLKPHNLLLAGPTVKVLDLGLARRRADGPASLTGTGEILGTPDYVAPEQAGDPRQVDGRADLYALGCTLYFLLAGEAPFAGGTGIEKLLRHRLEEPTPLNLLRDDVPAGVRAIVAKLMAKAPEDRYQTGTEVAEALARWAADATPVVRDGETGKVARGTETVSAGPTEGETAATMLAPPTWDGLRSRHPRRRQTSRFTRRTVLLGLAGVGAGAAGLAAVVWGWPRPMAKTTRGGEPPIGPERPPQPPSPGPGPVAASRWRAGPVYRCPERGHGVFGIAFDPAGTDLAVACGHLGMPFGTPGPVYRLSAVDGRWERLGAHARCAASRVAFTPDGRTLLSASGLAPHVNMNGSGELVLWDWPKRTLSKSLVTLPTSVYAVAADPMGRWMAAGCRQGLLVTLDPEKGSKVHDSPDSHRNTVTSLAASPDGLALACGYNSGMVRVIDPLTHEVRNEYQVPPEEVRDGRGYEEVWGLAFRKPDWLVGTVWVRSDTAEIRTWIARRDAIRLPESKVYAIALAPDRRMLATGGQDEVVRIWDLDSRLEVFAGEKHGEPVYGLVFDKTGRRLVSCSSNGTVRIWEAAG